MFTCLENRYKIIQRLDCGGFGETFLAEDTHMPSGRQCVIKQLKPLRCTHKSSQSGFPPDKMDSNRLSP